MTKREGDWTPDEVALTIWAHHQIQEMPGQRAQIVRDLAAELQREETAVAAAISAVAGGAGPAGMLNLLTGRGGRGGDPASNLLTDRTWATQVANVVRAHWQRPAP